MESKAKDYCIRAAIALLLMMFTGISAWAQDPASIGSIQYNSTLGAYEINSVQNLNDLAVYVNGRGTYSDNTTTETTAHSCEGLTFKQTANITYTGTNNYTPIGLFVYGGGGGFQGTFDGQGNTISGIYCTGDGLTGEESLGLFGWNKGTVRNVTLSGCRFASANNENNSENGAITVRIGSIAGINTGTISGCTVTGGTVSRTRTANAKTFEMFIGGIAGDNTRNITDCTYSGSVTGTYSGSNINTGSCTFRIGGIAGISENGGSITGCGSDAAVSCSAPNVSAPSLYVGGIAGLKNGMHRAATISDCFFSGTLSGTGMTGGNTSYIHIGAFVGKSINSSIVTNNYYYGAYASLIGYEDGAASHENLVRVYQLTGNGITATAPQGSGTTFKGVSYFKAAATVTLAPQTGYAITAASYNDGSKDHEITPNNGVWSFQMPSSDVTVTATFTVLPWTGDGTESSPYIIEYASQLDLLAYRVNGTHGETANDYDYTYFKLNNDISYLHNSSWNDFTSDESNYEAIGGYYDGVIRYFRGHFDGNNKTISGIRIYRDGNSNANNYQGIFGGTDSGADIHDLTLADARITGYNSTGGIVGYVGYNPGTTITRCHVADDVAVCAVQSHAYYHGGIVGRNRSGTIEQCTSAATLTIADAVNSDSYGGIAGSNSGTLRDNLAIGATVPAAADNAYGAITGYNDGSLQRNYYAACKVANTENATGVGCEAADVAADNGAVPGYFITLSEGITIAAGATTFTIPAHGETAEVTYHVAAAGANVTLSYSGTTGDAPDGYQYGFTASAGTLSGSTLTMPAADVTVSFGLTVLPWSGDGSEGNPFIIYNKDQLDLLAHRVNGTHGETANDYNDTYFKLNNNISYPHKADGEEGADTESNYEAIGGRYNGNDCYFCGHFDGNNKTISGIRIYKDGTGDADIYQGIFGYTDQYADIHDLTLADARITGYDDTGGIVGINDGTVTRCHVAGDVAVCAVQSGAYWHGGIVGYNSGTIKQCTSAATLTTDDAANSKCYGGIAGDNWGTLSDNLAIGATVPAAKGNSYGAITGRNDDDGSLQRNYYAACKVADTENATGVGCGYISDGNGGYTTADVNNDNNPDGAVCINTLALAANQAPDGNFWTTYYNSALGFTIDADENACAYTAEYDNTDPNAPQLTLHKLGKVIPKGTAVIIVGADNSISMTASDETATVSTNNLQGYDVLTSVADIKATLGDGTLYVMGKVGDVFGFYQYTAQYMPAHKAFLLVNGGVALTKELRMVVEDDADGIDSLSGSPEGERSVYDLSGRRVQVDSSMFNAQCSMFNRLRGIYIVNGKKILK